MEEVSSAVVDNARREYREGNDIQATRVDDEDGPVERVNCVEDDGLICVESEIF